MTCERVYLNFLQIYTFCVCICIDKRGWGREFSSLFPEVSRQATEDRPVQTKAASSFNGELYSSSLRKVQFRLPDPIQNYKTRDSVPHHIQKVMPRRHAEAMLPVSE